MSPPKHEERAAGHNERPSSEARFFPSVRDSEFGALATLEAIAAGKPKQEGHLASTPCWLERSLDSIRSTWLDGIRKVVEAGADEVIHVVAAEKGGAAGMTARIGNELGAPVVRPLNPEDVWPFRENEFVRSVLRLLPDGIRFNGHDVRSLRQAHGIDPGSHPEFVFKCDVTQLVAEI